MDQVQNSKITPSADQASAPLAVQKNERKREQTALEKAKKLKAKRAAEEFKKRYFSFYDDVKISDREDW